MAKGNMQVTPTPEDRLLRRIQDALVNAFYDPDPADHTPEVDYAVVDWVGVVTAARSQLDKYKSMASWPSVSPQPEPPDEYGELDRRITLLPRVKHDGLDYINLTAVLLLVRSKLYAASQPAAVPVQDALTTLVETLRTTAQGLQDEATELREKQPLAVSRRHYCDGKTIALRFAANKIEAALRREPPAVRTEK